MIIIYCKKELVDFVEDNWTDQYSNELVFKVSKLFDYRSDFFLVFTFLAIDTDIFIGSACWSDSSFLLFLKPLAVIFL